MAHLSRPSRRAVVRGAVWTVPAVTLVTGAPAYAASGAPTVSRVSPNNGPFTGGQTVTVLGTGFVPGATIVEIGGAMGTEVNVISATQLTVVTPARASGRAVEVTVTTPGGTATQFSGYYYFAPPTITSIDPASGSTNGGTSVTIRGSEFPRGSTRAFFGGVEGTVDVFSPDTAFVVAPAHVAGVVDVIVSNNSGTATLSNGFTYVTPA